LFAWRDPARLAEEKEEEEGKKLLTRSLKTTMNSMKATNLIAKFNKVPTRRKVQTQTLNFLY